MGSPKVLITTCGYFTRGDVRIFTLTCQQMQRELKDQTSWPPHYFFSSSLAFHWKEIAVAKNVH